MDNCINWSNEYSFYGIGIWLNELAEISYNGLGLTPSSDEYTEIMILKDRCGLFIDDDVEKGMCMYITPEHDFASDSARTIAFYKVLRPLLKSGITLSDIKKILGPISGTGVALYTRCK